MDLCQALLELLARQQPPHEPALNHGATRPRGQGLPCVVLLQSQLLLSRAKLHAHRLLPLGVVQQEHDKTRRNMFNTFKNTSISLCRKPPSTGILALLLDSKRCFSEKMDLGTQVADAECAKPVGEEGGGLW